MQSIGLETYYGKLKEADFDYDTLLLMNDDDDFVFLNDAIDDENIIDRLKKGIRLNKLKLSQDK